MLIGEQNFRDVGIRNLLDFPFDSVRGNGVVVEIPALAQLPADDFEIDVRFGRALRDAQVGEPVDGNFRFRRIDVV